MTAAITLTGNDRSLSDLDVANLHPSIYEILSLCPSNFDPRERLLDSCEDTEWDVGNLARNIEELNALYLGNDLPLSERRNRVSFTRRFTMRLTNVKSVASLRARSLPLTSSLSSGSSAVVRTFDTPQTSCIRT